MEDTSNDVDAVIAEIKAGNARRDFTPVALELGEAAITRLAIESATDSAS